MLELINELQEVYILGIAMLLDGTHRSVKFMESMWGVKLPNDWKQVTMEWATLKDFSDAFEDGIVDMVSVQ